MRISELADQAGVPVSTVRYYERIGLLVEPARTSGGYREYDDESASRLLFVSRARRLGLSCEQIADLIPVWGGANCTSARVEVTRLIDEKKAEIAARVAELRAFAAQLEEVRRSFLTSSAPHVCRTDLSCCVPSGPVPVQIAMGPPS